MRNKGNIYIGALIFYVFLFLFFMFFGIAIFQITITSELHNIKSDMYLINRNVLLALQRDIMGEDKNSFYEQDVKKLVEEEIKRLWNADVSCITERGFVYKVNVKSAYITNEKEKMYIESVFNIELRPIVFREILQGKLVFDVEESVKVEKMKGWSDD